jgi:hypothetical protein
LQVKKNRRDVEMKIRENEALGVKRKLLHTQEIDERKVNVCPKEYSLV